MDYLGLYTVELVIRSHSLVIAFYIGNILEVHVRRLSILHVDLRMSPFQPVAVLVKILLTCRRFDLSPFWFVTGVTINPTTTTIPVPFLL